MQIFTPLVGSLVYELRADEHQLLIVDYNQDWYVLEQNTTLSRQTWLGMDLSLAELEWILNGAPKVRSKKGWLQTELGSGDRLLQRGRKSIRLRFDSGARIREMETMLNGMPEYTVKITQYHPGDEISTPRKLRIADFSGAHEMVMFFSSVTRPPSFRVPLSFTPPEGIMPYVPDS